ncbi:MAG: sigma-54-dependent Fis family transcriptional regulator, partial [Deltaproteobacteria bacterium]|nr:sigma-54-dependent Fis family transcriptional regulator [Deltaproteobacteria bacterium]
APDGEEGLKSFKENRPDVILVDLRMPKVNGFQVLETVSHESPDTPIIVISGEGEVDDVIQALRMGAWNYQTKPVTNLVFLLHAVRQAMEKAHLRKENKAYQKGLELRLSKVIENFNGFVFTCDKDCRVTYMNPALIKYCGYDATGEHCHKAIFDSVPDEDWCRKREGVYEIQSKLDGRWFQVVQSPILAHDGTLMECQVILYDITERKKEIMDLREQEEYLRTENMRLKASLSDRYKFGSIIGKSQAMQEVYENIVNASASDAGVIIYGESGTGKELVAREIHNNSSRKDRKLIYVNCGAIPENLIESEFFGYKKGAFTGATKDKHGFLDIAEGGTLFLDEIGEIPLNMQVKLLRAIEGRGYTPVGSTETKKTDIRIIAATNRDLKELVRKGLMRQDFFYRIQIIPVYLPPLRERKEDIPLLLDHFFEQYEKKSIPPVTARIREALQNYDWPGNVRELQNTIHRFITLKKLDFIAMNPGNSLYGEELPDDVDFKEDFSLNQAMDVYEKRILEKALSSHNWHKTRAADALKIDRKTLFNKMKKHDLLS